jgi:glutamate-1-semialdehyde 2,1-aminomutase
MRTFKKSESFLERAQRVIPLGSQTFSKSRTQYPLGVSPFFILRAEGSRVWDLDGNEYIDFVSGLASVTLGYNDPDVTSAVRKQLDDSGVIFSLPHPLEAEVAELICEMVPCAQMVRFGKNGSDATAGAVRVARAFTGRDRIAVCGYHGWQDWYIGSTARNQGVPKAVSELTHAFPFNDLAVLTELFNKYQGEFAAVVIEPMNVLHPQAGFLEGVKELAHKHGALLVFDETITGFRYSNGGAQEYFGVIPDLATFGKGLANGYPVSAVTGRADVMKMMEEIFFSFTFGGEALSLAAAKATLTKLKNEPVTKTLAERGMLLMKELAALIVRHRLQDIFATSGHPSWSFLTIKDARGATSFQIKTLWMQEMHQRGFLCVGSHNLSWAHSDADIQALIGAYDEVLPMIGRILDEGRLLKVLRCEPLVPLFKVR